MSQENRRVKGRWARWTLALGFVLAACGGETPAANTPVPTTAPGPHNRGGHRGPGRDHGGHHRADHGGHDRADHGGHDGARHGGRHGRSGGQHALDRQPATCASR